MRRTLKINTIYAAEDFSGGAQHSFVLAVIALFIVLSVEGRPSNEMMTLRNSSCHNNEEKRDMCMYCAKQTKSPYTYPNCCTNQDNVHKFCEAFTKFGLRVY